MTKCWKLFPWTLLGIAFFAAGMVIRITVPSTSTYEIWGYDYGRYTADFASLDWISYMPFRHPLLGLISSPFVVVFSWLAGKSILLYHIALQFTFALLGVLSVWIVRKIAGWGAVCVFITFPFLWLIAAIPESYAFSMVFLLATAWWAINQTDVNISEKWKNFIWATLFVLAGGVTITNSAKVVVAYIIANKMSKKQMFKLILVGALVLIFAVLFFGLRMWWWNLNHPESKKNIATAIAQTLRWSFVEMSITERLANICCNFFAYPLTMGCQMAIWWAVVVYIAAVAGIWILRKERIAWIMLGMFSVDVAIHIVCGWAISEAWIFSPHWMWMLPIFIGVGVLQRLKRDSAEL